MPLKLPGSFAFIDTETTGTNSLKDRIIEIGIIRVENGRITGTLNTLVNPEIFVSPFISTMTGIDPVQLQNAPLFAEIHRSIEDILDGCCFVAHNVRFDYSFIRSEFKRLGKDFSAPLLCTVKLSRSLFPEHSRHNLDSIINRFQLTVANRHRALDDAQAIYEFFNLAKTRVSPDNFNQTLAKLLKKPSLPPHLDHDTLARLPESPGVYIFYGEDNTPLYIGKSKNIRSRVSSHFTGDLTSPKEMKLSQSVRSIKAIPTAGELGALLLESSLIKQLLPLHNRLLRRQHKMLLLRQTTDPNGYHTVSLETASHITPDSYDQIISVFRSRLQAHTFLDAVAKEHKLCPKLLGLDKSESACFSYHLGQCRGACLGHELPAIYNLRFLLAFSKHRLSPWPYPGAVLITENDPISGLCQCHLVHHWLHLGSFDSGTHPLTLLPDSTTPESIDIDTYKILKRFFTHPTPHSSIKPINPESTTNQIQY